MEPRFLFPSLKPSYFSPLPLFDSNSFLLLKKSKLYMKPHYSLSLQNSQFFGTSLVLSHGNVNLIKTRNFHAPIWPIKVAMKRRRDNSFENVAQRDKRLRFVLKLRRILLRERDRTMSIKDLGRYKAQLGTLRKRQFVDMLKKFPAVFQIMDEGLYSLKFKMTPEAEKLYLEELKIRSEMEELLVMKLRKLLMMSIEKRILLKKITHLRTDFGLPQGFHETICYGYPQYFRVVVTGRGPALELTHWDAELAASAAELSLEETRIKEENDLLMERPERFNREKFLKGLKLSSGEIRRIMQFGDMPYISPYSDFSSVRSGTKVNEKHDCGVVHEILSLTVEKQTLVDNLSHFREEFGLSQQVREMLLRHPDMFYVSLKGEMDCVFLREAYHGSKLIEKDPLMHIKEKLRSLVAVSHQNEDALEKNDSRKYGSGEEEGEWSDAYNFVSDERFEHYDTDDDWRHQEDDTPPNFFEDVETLDIGQESSFLFP
ncbi:unnamed protein product [Lupinus luteus]|uniref:PORR domain-containing protein n=1 Tax=Lupinus luteus TaxID=3873 RepID=A0AAV1X8K3_LUPLU